MYFSGQHSYDKIVRFAGTAADDNTNSSQNVHHFKIMKYVPKTFVDISLNRNRGGRAV